MKKAIKILTVSVLANLFLFITAFAQIPDRFSYQSILRDPDGKLLTNQTIGVKVSIVSEKGLSVYSETHTATTNENGLVSFEIGGGLPDGLENLGNIDWSIGQRYVQIEIDPEGGDNYTITTSSQLLSVPYALLAKNVVGGSGGTSISKLGEIEYLDAMDRVISGVNDPSEAKDVVNKQYLDSRLKNIEDMIEDLIAASLTVTDSRDGQVYEIGKFCNQWWMKENLNYNPNDASRNTYYYNNDSISNYLIYGRLYHGPHLYSENICPDGWRVPTDNDWKTLEMCFEMTQAQADATGLRGTDQGKQMKSNTNWDGTNTKNLDLVPGGNNTYAGVFSGKGTTAFYWTSTITSGNTIYYRQFTSSENRVNRATLHSGNNTASVRCIRN
jgi:uncharacterized protein (TIGR02145 family)